MKAYLGDSVYVDYDGYALILTTENGMGPSNTIYLEPSVYYSLFEYVRALKEAGSVIKKDPRREVLGEGQEE